MEEIEELKLKWKRHLSSPSKVIVGQAPELPDRKCWYLIAKLREDEYSIQLPALSTDDYFRWTILRDPEVARQFCQDDLYFNFHRIVDHQIRQYGGSNMKMAKGAAHYYQLLEKYKDLIEKYKRGPKVAA